MNKGGVGHRRHRMMAIIRSRTSTEMKMKITNALVDSPDGDITRVPPRTKHMLNNKRWPSCWCCRGRRTVTTPRLFLRWRVSAVTQTTLKVTTRAEASALATAVEFIRLALMALRFIHPGHLHQIKTAFIPMYIGLVT